MLFVALASDYDGTLARDGSVDVATLQSLRDAKAHGRLLLLVTGRTLPELRRVFEAIEMFDAVVAENGALLFMPATGQEEPLSAAPPENFIAAVRARGITPLEIGRGILATWHPNETAMLDIIRTLGLEWQLIFNKGAVMSLAPGVNKASGLHAALNRLKLSPHNVIAVGDAENDHAFLTSCGAAVAVANALPAIKEAADIVTVADHGAGVSEVIADWLADAPRTFESIRRHDLYIGDVAHSDAGRDGAKVALRTDSGAILICGHSGAGKTRLATLLLARLVSGDYQTLVIDPEGDYADFDGISPLGNVDRSPTQEEVLGLLDRPQSGIILNLLGVEVADRPRYCTMLLGQVLALRAKLGRPHWLLLDEAHHLLPARGDPHQHPLPTELPAVIFVTTEPEKLALAALATVTTVIAVGESAHDTLAAFCSRLEIASPTVRSTPGKDEVLLFRRGDHEVQTLRIGQPKRAHLRHTRKYAEGRLGEDKSFYFRGPELALNLRAHNLASFLQLAQGVDEATWQYHLQRGDYSSWLENSIRDPDLATDVRQIENTSDGVDSRTAIGDLIKRRYAAADVD